MNIQTILSTIVSRAAPLLLSAIIAAFAFLTGAITDVGQAVQVAITPERAIQQAADIINQTPPAEVEKALAE